MKKALSILLWLSTITLTASAKDSLDVQSQITIKLLEEKVNNLQQQLEKSEQHLKELQEAKKEEIEKLMVQKEDSINNKLILYTSFFIAVLGAVIWLFNWLGKREIRNIVSEIATKKVDEELAVKFSNEVIDKKLTGWGEPIIRKILQDLTEAAERAKLHEADFTEAKKNYDMLSGEMENWKKHIDLTRTTPEEKQKVKKLNKALEGSKTESEFSADDWFWKGIQARDEINHSLAIEYFTKAINLDANDSSYYGNRGYSYSEIKQNEKAIQDYEKAIQLNPKNPILPNNCGTVKNDAGKYEEAIKYFDAAIELRPNFSNPYRHRAFSHFKLGNLESALQDINKAIELKQGYRDAISLKGEILKAIESP